MLKVMLGTLDTLDAQIGDLDKEIARRSREDAVARRFMTIPGIGPITAVALAALAPPLEGFRKGRDFAAWLGLTPRQMSTGGKAKLGSITKMGDRTLRRLLIIGSTAVIRQARRSGAMPSLWLKQMLERKPPMLVAVALANKMARMAWAVTTRNEDYRAPALAN
jgi:transposase